MDFIIVTGFSGAGKSRAINALEDIGYYCIDNIPPALIKYFAQLCIENGTLNKVAVVTDTRGMNFFSGFIDGLNELQSSGSNYEILFLEASSDVLVNRYKETRRKHPLLDDADGSIEQAVELEKSLLTPIRARANYIIDTTLLSPAQLKERISDLFMENPAGTLNIHCMSFGFKYGPATEADLKFDVRCLPNPYYIDELRHKTGLDDEVKEYVLSNDNAKQLLAKLIDLIDFLCPLYKKEGKSQLVIAIGCTGGKHRSVTFAEEIYKHLSNQKMKVTINHRDINKTTYS